ncbi:hypothetical protein B0H17DRAFT_1209401 [Mycena rosella]|uniref:Uncharacterized protein n=1 Tax=Mycena rosella TaxID=1033263 RepID=A0AAD7G8J0_MYCRO|nr:hypothetical protein B0H17DRAFT_1209401 [Mycena rosella]
MPPMRSTRPSHVGLNSTHRPCARNALHAAHPETPAHPPSLRVIATPPNPTPLGRTSHGSSDTRYVDIFLPHPNHPYTAHQLNPAKVPRPAPTRTNVQVARKSQHQSGAAGNSTVAATVKQLSDQGYDVPVGVLRARRVELPGWALLDSCTLNLEMYKIAEWHMPKPSTLAQLRELAAAGIKIDLTISGKSQCITRVLLDSGAA